MASIASGRGGIGGKSGRVSIDQSSTDPPPINFTLAAFTIQDALEGRDKHGLVTMYEKPQSYLLAFTWHTHAYWAYLVFVSVFIHCFGVFFEEEVRAIGIGCSVQLLVILGIDTGLKMFFMSPRDFLGKEWTRAQVSCFNQH